MTNFIKADSITNICVYSSSSNELDTIYYEVARELGVLMGREGFNLVYGGGSVGTMYENAKAVHEFGGKVIGIIPEKLHAIGVGNPNCDELIVTKCMRTRKEKLDTLSDAMIAISGGFGTLEELSEMIVQKQLGYNNKAVVILNTDGFYDSLIEFFEVMIEKNFAHVDARELYFVAKTPLEAINYLKSYVPKHFDIKEKLNLK